MMFSRIGRSDPGGKLTSRLDVPVSEELADAVTALATIAGVSKSEWVRALLEKTIWGELSMMRRVSGLRSQDQWEEYR